MILGVFLAGCDRGPRAPALRDTPVYQNDREGFRFLAPVGWTLSARTDVPAGKVTRERTLVDYRRRQGRGNASLRVSLVDLPAAEDLTAYLTRPSFGLSKWVSTAPTEEVQVGTVPGVRYSLRGDGRKGALVREVVAVRRGERVYFFTAVYDPKDAEVRDELRQVITSVIWKQ